jgi:hypothetical protein
MKPQSGLTIIPKLFVLLLCFYIFIPQLALASTYGSSVYGDCHYQEGCSSASGPGDINPIPNKSFFNKYEWLIFGVSVLIFILLLITLLIRRRKNSKNESNRLPPPPPGLQT